MVSRLSPPWKRVGSIPSTTGRILFSVQLVFSCSLNELVSKWTVLLEVFWVSFVPFHRQKCESNSLLTYWRNLTLTYFPILNYYYLTLPLRSFRIDKSKKNRRGTSYKERRSLSYGQCPLRSPLFPLPLSLERSKIPNETPSLQDQKYWVEPLPLKTKDK